MFPGRVLNCCNVSVPRSWEDIVVARDGNYSSHLYCLYSVVSGEIVLPVILRVILAPSLGRGIGVSNSEIR
jgi:hypothetical protein